VRQRPRAVRASAKTGVARATNGRKTVVEVPGGGGVLQWPVVARDMKLVTQMAMSPRQTAMVSVGGGACAGREEWRTS
jgi:3-dehydroquinate synthetase